MTHAEAVEIRTKQLLGGEVDMAELDKALYVIKSKPAPPRKKRVPRVQAPANPWKLTARQCKLLNLLVDGYTQEQAAGIFDVGRNCVCRHVAHIKKSMCARTAIQAAVMWSHVMKGAA